MRRRNPVTTDTLLVEPKHLQPTCCNRVHHAQCPLDVLFRYVPTVNGGLSRRNVKVRNFLFNDAVSRYKYVALVVDQLTCREHCWNDTDGGKAEVLG